jgi:hypothetical protein
VAEVEVVVLVLVLPVPHQEDVAGWEPRLVL